ncbi:hypothetical protein PIB30_019183 [Stylosanthes scabra]|uniref:GRF-type domain-containing protein n=1 Tax=Stylosanthes scabra TaxID=79078 RepID=A0ABU6Z4R5_9FABA|nr:hypothetical protein [Stylosanthes scabra]
MAGSKEMRSRMTQSTDDVALKSKTKNNPNRWFYRCPKWKNKDGCCKYFQWMDEMQEEAVGVEECSANINLVKVAGKVEIDSLTMKEHKKKVELLLFAIMVGVVIIVLMGLVSIIK